MNRWLKNKIGFETRTPCLVSNCCNHYTIDSTMCLKSFKLLLVHTPLGLLKSCNKTTIESFLNKFHWIQRIQWIMTKSKSGMVTKCITHLLTDTLPVLLIYSAFSLLPLGRYLLPLTTLNRYQPTVSSGKSFLTTTSRNVTIVTYRMSLATILVLDFVMIYWICWIQRRSFRENSNVSFRKKIERVVSFCETLKVFQIKILPYPPPIGKVIISFVGIDLFASLASKSTLSSMV